MAFEQGRLNCAASETQWQSHFTLTLARFEGHKVNTTTVAASFIMICCLLIAYADVMAQKVNFSSENTL